ncbi:MAG TPA: hypothetical protein VE973_02885 [Candidatus Limnocylindria bacterium]|nr:hypothetical protein [Candidatus Limnocylindria bacterium]
MTELEPGVISASPEMGQKNHKIIRDIATKLDAIIPLVDEIMLAMKDAGWSAQDIENAETPLNELLVNMVEYGNMGLRKIKGKKDTFAEQRAKAEADPEIQKRKVHLLANISPNTIRITAQDEGGQAAIEEMKKFQLKDLELSENLLADSGRGYNIIENFFQINIESNSQGNKVTLTKNKLTSNG